MAATEIIKAGWTAWWPEFMRVAEPACMPFLRRLLNTRDAMLYWHSATKNWVLGVWETRNRQLGVSELHIVSNSPDMGPPELTRESVAEIIEQCYVRQDLLADLARMESDGRSQDEEAHEEFKENLLREEYVFKKYRTHDPNTITADDMRKMGEL